MISSKKGKLFLLISFSILCVFSTASLAKTLVIPGDYPDLRTAYEEAESHDTIMVKPGYYAGDNWTEIFFFDKPVKLISQGGPSVTTLDGRGIDRGMHFRDLYDGSMLVDGFTITNCIGELIGAVNFHENSSGTLRNCIIENCHASSTTFPTIGEGGGLRIWGSDPLIENVTIRNCSAMQGGGVNILRYAAPVFKNVRIENCDGAALMAAEYCDPTFEDCQFVNNTPSEVSWVAGVGMFIGSHGHFVRCLFEGNDHDINHGGGVIVEDSDTIFDHCMFINNTAVNLAGGVMAHNGGTPTFNYCTIAGNSAGVNGDGIGLFNGSHAVFNNCIIWQPGSELYLESGGTAEFNYCNISTDISGNGNYSEDPGFTDDTYHIPSDSPCRDRGQDTGERIDIDGDWVEDSAEVWDTGADEYFESVPGTVSLSLNMPSSLYSPGSLFRLDAALTNTGSGIKDAALIVVLDVFGEFYMWPSWNTNFSYDIVSIPGGESQVSIIPLFNWPSGTGSASGLFFHGGVMSYDISTVLSNIESVEFGWTE